MKVSQAILWSFVIVVVLFCSASFINHRKTETLLTQARDQARLVDVVRLSERFQRNFVGMVSNLQGYLFTGQRSFMQGYDSCKSQNEEILAELKASFPEGSDERIILDDIQELEKYWVEEFAIPLREAKWQVVTLNGNEQDFEALYNRKRAPRLDEDVQRSLAGKFGQLVKPDEAVPTKAPHSRLPGRKQKYSK